MAIAIDSAKVYRVLDTVLSDGERTVRNDGPNVVTVGKDPNLVAGGGTTAGTITVAVNGEERIFLEAGESLFAKCAAAQTASIDVV